MQHRMKELQMNAEESKQFLHTAMVGRLGTLNENGYPYVTCVHFVYEEGRIFIHGLPKGQKMDNILRNSKVCFEVDEMIEIKNQDLTNPCAASTKYNSVIVMGKASLVTDLSQHKNILDLFTTKYVPHMSGSDLPPQGVKATAVVSIDIEEMTGKSHP